MRNSNTSPVVQAILQARRKGIMQKSVGGRSHTLFTALEIAHQVQNIRSQADAYVLMGAAHQVLMDLGEHLAETVSDREWDVATLVHQASQVMINAAQSADRWLSERKMEVNSSDANFYVWSLYLSLEDESALSDRRDDILASLQDEDHPGNLLIYGRMLTTINSLMRLYDLAPDKPFGRQSELKNDRPN
jgi:hypothetical protein